MKSPLVSVIVPTYNRPELLARALESIFDQSMQDFEVVVVNDHGPDVSKIISSYPGNKIRYVSHIENLGPAASRNTGIAAASGKYVAYLDDDDIYYPNHLKVLAGFLETSGMPAAYADAMVEHIGTDTEGQTISEREPYPSVDFHNDLILAKNTLPLPCMVHLKSCIEAVGGFREDFAAHEDWELWIRISARYPIVHVNTITCEFKYSEQGGNITANRLELLRTMLAIYHEYRLPAETDPAIPALRAQMVRSVEQTCRNSSAEIDARIARLYEQYEAYDEMIRFCSELMREHGERDWAAPMARALKKQGRLSEAVQLLSAIG